MDFAILDDKHREVFNFSDSNRVKWTADGKSDGNPYGLKALDPTLLTLYAHQMVVSDSSTAALNWYFRAHVLRPDDPVIMFCIGLSYISHAFKRQSHNRQYHLQQGLTFITRYCDVRRKDNIAIHLQEAEYNMGMTWHSLGLVHLALPAYEKCIQLSGRVQKEGREGSGQTGVVEDFAADAAYAMQSILAMGGDAQGARNVSKKWLVI
jgi:general transcription factor 3C polypeptide 3 (transcription factor C subunit 4)